MYLFSSSVQAISLGYIKGSSELFVILCDFRFPPGHFNFSYLLFLLLVTFFLDDCLGLLCLFLRVMNPPLMLSLLLFQLLFVFH